MSKEEKKKIYKFSDLFNPEEKKELLRKYLYFLGWIEILIFVGCWIYQLGSTNVDRMGNPVDIPFPWKAYFTISFLAPILITFVIGVIIAGFNRYLIDKAGQDQETAPEKEISQDEAKQPKILKLIGYIQHVPFLGLLLLLGFGVVILYNIDTIMAVIGTIGEKTVKITIMFIIGIIALISIFAMVLIVLNYKLRKRSMEYRFRTEMADRFGLIILEDNTVLNHKGELLVQGKKWKKSLPIKEAKQSKEDKASSTNLTHYPLKPSHASTESTE